MNGAIAELCARMIKVPTTKRMINMGTSHHLLLLQKNENKSRMIPRRPVAVCMAVANPITFLLMDCFKRLDVQEFGSSVKPVRGTPVTSKDIRIALGQLANHMVRGEA